MSLSVDVCVCGCGIHMHVHAHVPACDVCVQMCGMCGYAVYVWMCCVDVVYVCVHTCVCECVGVVYM